MRRLLATEVHVGEVALDEQQSHHARSVLRMNVGDPVELFDRDGRQAHGIIRALEPRLVVRIEQLEETRAGPRPITIASAVPKGDRADWLVEKLSEIGVACWVPLRTARSVVHPEGVAKFDRWRRIAEESAKQCRRSGVMEIGELRTLDAFLSDREPAHCLILSTAPTTTPIWSRQASPPQVLLVGPEGGWTPEEESQMLARGLTPATLGPTILRIETAAVVGAGVVAAFTHTIP